MDLSARPGWADDPIGRQWWEFHRAHPDVFYNLGRLTAEWRAARPGEPVSIKMLWERLRWETAIGDRHADYRLNNNFTSLYARWLMERYPEWKGTFRLRARHGEQPDKADRPWFTAYAGCPSPPCGQREVCRGQGRCAEVRG